MKSDGDNNNDNSMEMKSVSGNNVDTGNGGDTCNPNYVRPDSLRLGGNGWVHFIFNSRWVARPGFLGSLFKIDNGLAQADKFVKQILRLGIAVDNQPTKPIKIDKSELESGGCYIVRIHPTYDWPRLVERDNSLPSYNRLVPLLCFSGGITGYGTLIKNWDEIKDYKDVANVKPDLIRIGRRESVHLLFKKDDGIEKAVAFVEKLWNLGIRRHNSEAAPQEAQIKGIGTGEDNHFVVRIDAASQWPLLAEIFKWPAYNKLENFQVLLPSTDGNEEKDEEEVTEATTNNEMRLK